MLQWFFSDEKVRAKSIIDNGFTQGEFSLHEGQLVAKYALLELGCGDAKAKRYLAEFAEKNATDFNRIIYRDKLITMVRRAKASGKWKNKSDSITVTKLELDAIRKIRNFTAQKIMLVLLVFSKKGNGYVYNNQLSDLRFVLRMKNLSDEGITRLIHLAYKQGLVRDSYENLFVKLQADNSKGVIITISNLQDLYKIGETYTKYCGGEISYCSVCGAEFLKSSNRDLYCTTHKKEAESKRKRDYKARRRLGGLTL